MFIRTIITLGIAVFMLGGCGIKGDLRHPDTGKPVHDASSKQEWMSVPVISDGRLSSDPALGAVPAQQ